MIVVISGTDVTAGSNLQAWRGQRHVAGCGAGRPCNVGPRASGQPAHTRAQVRNPLRAPPTHLKRSAISVRKAPSPLAHKLTSCACMGAGVWVPGREGTARDRLPLRCLLGTPLQAMARCRQQWRALRLLEAEATACVAHRQRDGYGSADLPSNARVACREAEDGQAQDCTCVWGRARNWAQQERRLPRNAVGAGCGGPHCARHPTQSGSPSPMRQPAPASLSTTRAASRWVTCLSASALRFAGGACACVCVGSSQQRSGTAL